MKNFLYKNEGLIVLILATLMLASIINFTLDTIVDIQIEQEQQNIKKVLKKVDNRDWLTQLDEARYGKN